MLDAKLLPTFGDIALKDITADLVDDWYYRLGDEAPTSRAHAYGLLRTILADAVQRRLITYNPCHIRGAGNVKRAKQIEPATLPELEALAQAMPERYRLMVLLAAWCGLRFGEITELRRHDVDLTHGVVKVRRAVVRVDGDFRHRHPEVRRRHTRRCHPAAPAPRGQDPPGQQYHRRPRRTALPGGRRPDQTPGTRHALQGLLQGARGRWQPDLRFHDLRHTGAVLAASTGATLAELMARLGHSTAGAALRYHRGQGPRQGHSRSPVEPGDDKQPRTSRQESQFTIAWTPRPDDVNFELVADDAPPPWRGVPSRASLPS